MAKKYDATLNTLIDAHVADWVGYLAAHAGLPHGPAEVIDTDLSVTAQADRLFKVGGPTPYILHLELESSGQLGLPTKLLRYNVPTHGLYELPVHSVVMLLRPKANATDLTGALELPGADGRPYLSFRYSVVRVWQEPFDGLFGAGLGTAPMALLTDEAANALPEAFGRFVDRLREPDVPAKVAEDLLHSVYMLCGLRYDPEQVATLYRSLGMTLEDSSTYQLVLSKGEAKGLAEGQRTTVLRLGTKRFGPPSPATSVAFDAVADTDRLGRIADRLLDADGWDDLLATP